MADDDETYTVTCGAMVGTLHMNRFLCPGIHQTCIEVNGTFVSPKTFSIMGDKGKLKNWKNAVRINGKNIRKLMDTGELDFFNHVECCTGKCMSRNAGVSKYDVNKFDGLDSGALPGLSPTAPFTGLPDPLSDDGDYGDLSSRLTPSPGGVQIKQEPKWEDGIPPNNRPTNTNKTPKVLGQLVQGQQQPSRLSKLLTSPHVVPGSAASVLPPGAIPIQMSNGRSPHGAFVMTPNGLVQLQPMQVPGKGHLVSPLMVNSMHSASSAEHRKDSGEPARSVIDLPDDMDVMKDSHGFWEGILQVGLIDDFFREMKYGLDTLKNDLIKSRASAEDCMRTSKIVNQLGLVHRLKYKLDAHKTDTEKQTSRLNVEVELLKRKMEAAQQRQEQLKRKSDTFSNLLEAGRPNKRAKSSCSSPASSAGDASGSNTLVIASQQSETPTKAHQSDDEEDDDDDDDGGIVDVVDYEKAGTANAADASSDEHDESNDDHDVDNVANDNEQFRIEPTQEEQQQEEDQDEDEESSVKRTSKRTRRTSSGTNDSCSNSSTHAPTPAPTRRSARSRKPTNFENFVDAPEDVSSNPASDEES